MIERERERFLLGKENIYMVRVIFVCVVLNFVNGRGYLRKKRSELAITLSPKWIVFFVREREREKEREKGQESRGWVQ